MRIKLYPEYPEGVPALITETQAADMLAPLLRETITDYILADLETEIGALLVRPVLTVMFDDKTPKLLAVSAAKDTFDESNSEDSDNWLIYGAPEVESISFRNEGIVTIAFNKNLPAEDDYTISIMAETDAFDGKRVPSLVATITIPAE